MKEKGISIKKEDLLSFQEIQGQSLTHICCGRRMLKIKNLTAEDESEFYICSKNCGSVEIPYTAQILKYDGKGFHNFSSQKL